MRRKLRTALIAALAAASLTAGLARADGRPGILERLFPYGQPSEVARQLLTPVGRGMADGPCALSVDEWLFDGSELHVTWTAKSESADTVLFTAGSPESPSQTLVQHGGAESLRLTTFVPLGDSLNENAISREFHGYTVVTLPDGAGGNPFDVTLRGVFLQPIAPVVMGSEIKEDIVNRPTWVAERREEQVYLNFFSNVTSDPEGGYSSDSQDVDPYMRGLTENSSGAEIVDAYVKGLTGRGYARLLSELAVTFTVTPDTTRICRTGIDGPATFEFDDRTVTITRADFAAAHTRVEGVMLAKGNLTEEDLFDLYYELCPDGQPTAARIQNECGSGDAVSGRDCVEFSLCGDPLAEPPSMVLLEAYYYPLGFFNDSVGENEPVREPGYDIALKLKKAS
jgi:hypothetical protein